MKALTDEEAAAFWSYVQGGQFSGAARRIMMEFAAAWGGPKPSASRSSLASWHSTDLRPSP